MPDYDLGTARGRIELDASSLGRASAAFTGLGKVMVGTGLLAVGAFAYAVKSAADFEKQMSAVAAVSNATSAEMDALKEVALDLGSSTVYGANEVARAMEQLAKAGLPIADILGGATEATVALAAAAGDELAGGLDEAAVVMSNAMKIFGAGAEDAMHFADVIVAAAASSTLSVDDLAHSLRYAGPIAASLGLSIDDLSTLLAILGDRGIRGSTAGTSLRGVLLSLAGTTPKAAGVLKELGIITEDGTNRFYDMNGALKPIPEVMQILGDATKDLSEKEKVAAFNAIFQRRAMNAAMIMAEQGADGFYKYAEAIASLEASDVAAKKLDNLSGDVTILRNAFETLMIRVGLPFQEMLRGFVQGLTDLVSKLNEVNPELLAQIALYSAIGGAIVTTIGGMLLAVGMIIKMYRNFILLKEAIGLAVGAFKLLTISFLTNPVFLFVAALAAVAGALYLAYQRSEEFRARVDAALNALKPAFEAVVRFVQNFADQFGNLIDVFREGDDVAQGVGEVIDNMFGNTGKLVGPIRSLVTWFQNLDDAARTAFDYFANEILPVLWDFGIAVGQAVGEAVSWFVNTGIPAIQEFADAVMEQIGMAIGWVDRNVVPVFESLGGLIVAVVDRVVRVLRFFGPYFQMVWENGLDAARAAYTVIKTIVENIIIVFNNFSDNIVRVITGAWARIKQTIETALRLVRGIITFFTGLISGDWGKAWDGIKQMVSAAWALIGDIIQNAWFVIWELLSAGVDALISLWEVTWNTVTSLLGAAWDLIWELVKNGLQFIWDQIKNVLSLIANTWSTAWNAIQSFLNEKFLQIKSAVSNTLASVIQFFRELAGKIIAAVGGMGTLLYNKGKEIVQGLKNGIYWVWDSVINFFQGLPRKIIDMVGDLGNLLFNAGKKLIGGFIGGIKDAAGGIGNAIGGAVDKVASFVPGSPVKEGPLTVFNRGAAGRKLMEMFMEGIRKEAPALQTLMNMQLSGIGSVSASGGLGAAVPASSGAGNTSIVVTLEFPNVTSAKEAQEIENAMGNSTVLSQLARTLKAGRR